MKKAVLRGPGQVEVVEMDVPTPPDGGVVVKMEACAVCGTDVENYLHGQRMSQLPPKLNTHVFPLDRVVEALETMKQGDGLKILVVS